MHVLIRPYDVPETEAKADNVVMRPLVRRDLHGNDVSLTWVQLSGPHRRLRTERSTRVYYILSGSGEFLLAGRPAFQAATGDAVVVPRGVAYDFTGDMTYLVVNGPAFADGDDIFEE